MWPNLLTPTPLPGGCSPLFSGVRVFDKDYENPRVYTFTTGYEREIASDVSTYVDYTHARGRHPDAVSQLQPRRPGVNAIRDQAPATSTPTPDHRSVRSSEK